MTAVLVYYEGRVQGVGFRFTTKQLARGYEVTGWVRNLADGRVELCAAGEPREVADFLRELEEESALAGHIRGTERRDVPVPEGLHGFTIR